MTIKVSSAGTPLEMSVSKKYANRGFMALALEAISDAIMGKADSADDDIDDLTVASTGECIAGEICCTLDPFHDLARFREGITKALPLLGNSNAVKAANNKARHDDNLIVCVV
jgi:hypothetical protein